MPPRKRPMGRRPGAPRTRETLLWAARKQFMDKGFDGASVRSIASAAGVDAAMVNHYFGSKEGLFQAVMELPVEPAERARAVVDAARYEDIPHRLVTAFLSVWDSPETGPAMIALLRRSLADPAQLQAIRSFMLEAIAAPVAAVVATRHPADAQLRVSLTASYLIGTMTARHILRLEPLASLPTDALAVLMERTVTDYLQGDLGSASAQPSSRHRPPAVPDAAEHPQGATP